MNAPFQFSELAALGLILGLAGCAGSDSAKEASAKTAELLKVYETSARAALSTQGTVESMISESINDSVSRDEEQRARRDVLLESWTIAGDEDALEVYAVLTNVRAAEILTRSPFLTRKAATGGNASVSMGKEYQSATAAILELSKYGSFEDRMTFLFGAMKSIAKTIDEEKLKADSMP